MDEEYFRDTVYVTSDGTWIAIAKGNRLVGRFETKQEAMAAITAHITKRTKLTAIDQMMNEEMNDGTQPAS